MNDTSKILQALPIFSHLNPEEFETLSYYLVKKHYHTPGEVLLRQGSIGDDLYIITSGQVIFKIKLPGDVEKIAARLSAGHFFGEMAFLGDKPIMGTIIVEKELSCLSLSRNILEMIRISAPQTAYKIEHAIAKQASQKMTEHLSRLLQVYHQINLHHPILSGHAQFLPKIHARVESIDIAAISTELLKKIPILSSLTDEELQILLSCTEAKTFEKGFQLNEARECINTINIICTGAVMLFLKQNKKLLKAINIIGVSEIFINISSQHAFSQVTAYVTCESCLLLQVSLKKYLRLRVSHPPIFYKMSKLIHKAAVQAIFILNREFVRINTEYHDLLN